LFKHFPNKEALYAAVHASFTGDREPDRFGELMAVEPSTVALVRIVHAFYSALLPSEGLDASSDQAILARLMFRSLTEDGEFARSFLRRVGSRLIDKVQGCIAAAALAGDLDPDAELVPARLAGWFSHHLAVMLMLNHLDDPSIIDYGAPSPAVVEQAVRFSLRGIGLKDEVIRRLYRPEQWARGHR
jgi:AcrR family transcriptional regulator